MVINLKQLYEIPGEKLELDAQVSPERLFFATVQV